ncbi:restriction endonuclease [Pandoraea sputorum]|uniref:restriction endonuclease n=1 Tax=Pandoraea sputorum TaxID=93222 RepID=UPI0012408659|nr:restriction endonuclease [Pandoraea sputorum]
MVERILRALAESETKQVDVTTGDIRKCETNSSTATRYRTIAVMGILALLVGALVAVIPSVTNMEATTRGEIVMTAIASLALISLAVSVHRFRTVQEDPNSESAEMAQCMTFETSVFTTRNKSGGIEDKLMPGDALGDVVVDTGVCKYLFEVKHWRHKVPISLIAQLAKRLSASANELGAYESLVVTPRSLGPAAECEQFPGVVFVTEKRLAAYLKQPPTMCRPRPSRTSWRSTLNRLPLASVCALA